MTEFAVEAAEDEVDGRYSANALGYGIHTQGDSVKEIPRDRQGSRRLRLRRLHAAAYANPFQPRWEAVMDKRAQKPALGPADTWPQPRAPRPMTALAAKPESAITLPALPAPAFAVA